MGVWTTSTIYSPGARIRVVSAAYVPVCMVVILALFAGCTGAGPEGILPEEDDLGGLPGEAGNGTAAAPGPPKVVFEHKGAYDAAATSCVQEEPAATRGISHDLFLQENNSTWGLPFLIEFSATGSSVHHEVSFSDGVRHLGAFRTGNSTIFGHIPNGTVEVVVSSCAGRDVAYTFQVMDRHQDPPGREIIQRATGHFVSGGPCFPTLRGINMHTIPLKATAPGAQYELRYTHQDVVFSYVFYFRAEDGSTIDSIATARPIVEGTVPEGAVSAVATSCGGHDVQLEFEVYNRKVENVTVAKAKGPLMAEEVSYLTGVMCTNFAVVPLYMVGILFGEILLEDDALWGKPFVATFNTSTDVLVHRVMFFDSDNMRIADFRSGGGDVRGHVPPSTKAVLIDSCGSATEVTARFVVDASPGEVDGTPIVQSATGHWDVGASGCAGIYPSALKGFALDQIPVHEDAGLASFVVSFDASVPATEYVLVFTQEENLDGTEQPLDTFASTDGTIEGRVPPPARWAFVGSCGGADVSFDFVVTSTG